MPEETDPSQPVEADPTLFSDVPPDEMITRAMQTARFSAGTGHWEPPSIEEAANLFPGYAVLKLIGRGGMGAVYQARQIELDRLVAIKLLPLEVSEDREFADRFRREARALAKLHHPNIVAVFDFGTTSAGHLYFVMEFVEGANLATIIHQVGLENDQALSVAEQICTALAYAHRKGVIHRDIKPSNVMIDTESHVKVADFGLARLTDPGTEQMGATLTGTVMGTPDYMAPEQTRSMNVDHRADIYSLGVMLYEMLCRQVPKGVFQPPSTRISCDTRIDHIVIKAMQQAPENRYQSTQEMRADVTAARTPLPTVPTSALPPLQVTQPAVPSKALPAGARKRPSLMFSAGLVIAVVCSIVAAVHFGKPHAANEKEHATGGAVVPEAPGEVSSATTAPAKDDPFVGTWAERDRDFIIEIKDDHTAIRSRNGGERAQGKWESLGDGEIAIHWEGAATYQGKLSEDGKSMTNRKNMPMIRKAP